MIVRIVLAACLSGLAGWSFRGAFHDRAGLAVAFAVLAPVLAALAWGLLTRRLTSGLRMALGVLAVLSATALATRPGGDVLSGPSRLLTGLLPADPAPPELAAVAALTGCTALIAVRLACRSGFWSLLPALACLVLGLGLGLGAQPPAWYPVAFCAAAAGFVLSGQPLSRARVVAGALMILVAMGAGALVVPMVEAQPASLQSLVHAQVEPRQRTNPMSQYLALRNELLPLEITGTASAPVRRLRAVTLTEFDGRGWSVNAEYRRAGTQLPESDGRAIKMDVRLRYPDSVGWLPTAGRPGQISVPNLGFDHSTGDLVVPAGQSTPERYTVTSSEPVIDASQLATDTPAIVPTAKVSLPEDALALVDRATLAEPTAFGKFSGLYRAFTGPTFVYDNSPEAPGGNGVYQIAELLAAKRGTSEQYASAFAVLCRHLGWDARVVLGFRAPEDQTELSLRGRDVFAWVEVRFARHGWVSVDPSPSRTVDGKETSAAAKKDPIDAVANERSSPPPEPAPDVAGTDTASASGLPSGEPVVTGSRVLLLGLTVVLLALGGIPVANAARRRRARRVNSPRVRSLAAWRDGVHSLRALGLPLDFWSTTGQVLYAANGQFEPALRPLADIADRAAFAPEDVATGHADTAWCHADAIRSQLRGRLGRLRWLVFWLDPRQLWPRRIGGTG